MRSGRLVPLVVAFGMLVVACDTSTTTPSASIASSSPVASASAAASPSSAPPSPAPSASGSVSSSTPASPTPDPGPAETVALDVTDSSSTIVENNWRQPGLGVAHVQFTLSNTTPEPRYPTCLVRHWELENEGGRIVQRTWHGRAVVPVGGSRSYGVDIPRTPLDNRQRSDQTGFYEVSCSGSLARNRAARPSDPAPLPTRALSSDSVSLSGRRATLMFRVRITNDTVARVRPTCYVQVAATAVSRNWYPGGIRVSRYAFRPGVRLAAGRTTTVTHRVANVPVHVTGSKYFWVYDARCRVG